VRVDARGFGVRFARLSNEHYLINDISVDHWYTNDQYAVLRVIWCALFENDTFPHVERMAPQRHPMRDWVESMYRRGDLTSPSEGAFIASVPRQTVARWIREAGIKIDATRKQYLARNQLRAQRYVAGKPPRNKPSKKYLRRIAAKALKDWNRALKQKRVAEVDDRSTGH
jgi:hypothetical protein